MRRTLALLLLAASPAFGQDPAPGPIVNPLPKAELKVDHPEPVPPGVLVRFDATGSVGDDLIWDTEADESVYQVDSGKRKLFFASPLPGTYTFKVLVFRIVDGQVRVDKAKAKVVVEGAEPAPTPVPTPTPTPSPVPAPPAPVPVDPVAGHLHATLFYDVNDTGVTSIRANGKTIAAELAKLDCEWYALATISPAAKPFIPELAKDGSPVVVFQTADGRIVPDKALKSPKSSADVIAAVRAMRGGN